MILKLAHITVPVDFRDANNYKVYKDQQIIAFETLRHAKEQADPERLNIIQYAAYWPEDDHYVPSFFVKTKPLDRGAEDMADLPDTGKKHALIRDILDRVYEAAPDADYIIYTNSNVCVMPDFYTRIAELISEGWRGMVINKKMITDQFYSVREIPEMYEEMRARRGQHHTGSDCFVFSRNIYPQFELSDSCIGVLRFDRLLQLNVCAIPDSGIALNDEWITFQIGSDKGKPWRVRAHAPLTRYNIRHANRAIKRLKRGNSRITKEHIARHIDRYKNFAFVQPGVAPIRRIVLIAPLKIRGAFFKVYDRLLKIRLFRTVDKFIKKSYTAFYDKQSKDK